MKGTNFFYTPTVGEMTSNNEEILAVKKNGGKYVIILGSHRNGLLKMAYLGNIIKRENHLFFGTLPFGISLKAGGKRYIINGLDKTRRLYLKFDYCYGNLMLRYGETFRRRYPDKDGTMDYIKFNNSASFVFTPIEVTYIKRRYKKILEKYRENLKK